MEPFTFPKLGFPYTALEPYFDEETLRIHHDILHKGYVSKLNETLEPYPEFHVGMEELLASVNSLPLDIREAVRNNAGGHANHSLFWSILTPTSSGKPEGNLSAAIDENFGSFSKFTERFSEMALSHFSNGWAWLCADSKGALKLLTTPNHDNPITQGLTPLLTLDLWEHAYYLGYQNRREEYVKSFWTLVHWEEVSDRWDEFQTKGSATREWRQAS